MRDKYSADSERIAGGRVARRIMLNLKGEFSYGGGWKRKGRKLKKAIFNSEIEGNFRGISERRGLTFSRRRKKYFRWKADY